MHPNEISNFIHLIYTIENRYRVLLQLQAVISDLKLRLRIRKCEKYGKIYRGSGWVWIVGERERDTL
jgi:hypothetical protein